MCLVLRVLTFALVTIKMDKLVTISLIMYVHFMHCLFFEVCLYGLISYHQFTQTHNIFSNDIGDCGSLGYFFLFPCAIELGI